MTPAQVLALLDPPAPKAAEVAPREKGTRADLLALANMAH